MAEDPPTKKPSTKKPSTKKSSAEQSSVENPDEEKRTLASSLVLVNTGHGKGKSTAAFGTLIRGVARGWPTAVVQFLKSGDWRVGEEKICRQLGVDWYAEGDGFTWNSEDLDESAALAAAAWVKAKALIQAGEHRLIVLDEISYAMTWEWIDVDDVVSTLTDRPPKTSVILTGRDMHDKVIEVADTVTEMTNIKHAFDSGIVAKKGIDY